ncbi:MAG: hypothetical protein HC887_07770 [Desulfobacteraceae bacterium]|nr:hypothetical protein [Desulfobacteraceae bacterium]
MNCSGAWTTAVVDIMHNQPAEWLLQNRAMLQSQGKIYAVRGSSHTQDFLDAGLKWIKRFTAITVLLRLKTLRI